MADSLVVIRSGATDYDLQGRIRGTLDIPLSAEGMAEAHRIAGLCAAVERIDLIYTSLAACAVETSRIVGRALGLRPRRAPGLENLDQGLWQGMLVEDIRRKQPRLYRQWQDNPWAVSPPEGELLEEACVRVEETLEKISKRFPGSRIAVVVPPPLDQIVLWLGAGESIGDLWHRDPLGPVIREIPLASQWRRPKPALEKIRG
jgi:broad specificity phosphatase PhoE